MRKSNFLFAVFFLWVVGCTYYYMVHIKGPGHQLEAHPAQVFKEKEELDKSTATDTSGVYIVQNGRGMIIYYPSGKDVIHLNAKSAGQLKSAAKKLAETGSGANIIAHTDNQGEPKQLFELGKKHANMIKELFLNEGMINENLRATSMGPTQPEGDHSTEEGRAKNRRIVIVYNN